MPSIICHRNDLHVNHGFTVKHDLVVRSVQNSPTEVIYEQVHHSIDNFRHDCGGCCVSLHYYLALSCNNSVQKLKTGHGNRILSYSIWIFFLFDVDRGSLRSLHTSYKVASVQPLNE